MVRNLASDNDAKKVAGPSGRTAKMVVEPSLSEALLMATLS